MSQQKKMIRITIAIVLMIAVVAIAGELLYQVASTPVVTTEEDAATAIGRQEGQFQPMLGEAAPPPDGLADDGKRDLATYYERRAYPGAPPFIPHEVSPDMTQASNCLACHRHGGYAPKFKAFAPATPHPQLTSCQQCHVTRQTDELFRETTYEKPEGPELDQRALPGSPNPIPHGLQMHENCASCHSGPSAPSEIRTDHPERPGCLQCHVLQESDAAEWTRNSSEGVE